MKARHFAQTLVVLMVVAAICGCGRPTRPGEYFEGKKVDTSIKPKADAPPPEEPYFEAGPADAKVRILVFLPIDDVHQEVIALLKELVDEYPGKVYLKYWDPRTEDGKLAMARARMSSEGLLINSQSEMMIEAEPAPYRVHFLQDMGRFWTADDLRAAVAQAVREQYGPGQ